MHHGEAQAVSVDFEFTHSETRNKRQTHTRTRKTYPREEIYVHASSSLVPNKGERAGARAVPTS